MLWLCSASAGCSCSPSSTIAAAGAASVVVVVVGPRSLPPPRILTGLLPGALAAAAPGRGRPPAPAKLKRFLPILNNEYITLP